MTTTTRNGAADRLKDWLDVPLILQLDEALAFERHAGWLQGFAEGEPQHARATVERIRPAIEEIASLLRLHIPGRGAPDDVGFGIEWEALDNLRAILDEEAAR